MACQLRRLYWKRKGFVMRKKIILLLSLALLLLCPVTQAAEEQIFVARDGDGNYHSFYPDSIKLHGDTIVYQVRMDFVQSHYDVKYQTISMNINPLRNTYRMLAMTEYSETNEKLHFQSFNLSWQPIQASSIAQTSVQKMLNYCIQKKLPVKLPPGYPLPTFFFATSTPAGDALSFAPGNITISGDQISISIFSEYRSSQDNPSSETAVIHFLPAENKFRIDCREQTDSDGTKHLAPDIDWSIIAPGSSWNNLLNAVQKYCRQNDKPYVLTPAPPAFLLPAATVLASQSVSGDKYYYDPETIRNFADYFSVKVYCEYNVLNNGVRHLAATAQFCPAEHKYKLTAIELFNDGGFRLTTPPLESVWNDLISGSDMETTFNTIITYCAQNNISLNLPAVAAQPPESLSLPQNRILAYTSPTGSMFFFDPATIKTVSGCLTAQLITELPVPLNDIKYTSGLIQYRLSDKKYRLTAANLYDNKGTFLSSTPDFEWEDISSVSALAKVVINILDYCHTNNIQIP